MSSDLAESLSEALGAISGQLRLSFAETRPDEPRLGFIALATLRHLARHGPTSVSELAETDRVTTQAISVRVTSLVQNGLVERHRDPADARRTILSATKAGLATVNAAQDRGHNALTEALGSLSDRELEKLRRAQPTLSRLAECLRDQREPT